MSAVISRNLKKLLHDYNMEQKTLAKIAGVSESAAGKWILGKSTPRMGAIQKISDHFGIPKSYILNEVPDNIETLSPRTIRIPILGKIACGDPIDSEQNIEGYRHEFAEGLPNGDLVSLVADGDSMFPTIQNGSFVTFKKQPVVEEGQIAAVRFLETGEMTLKRIKRQGNMMLLVPDNKEYDTIVVTHDNPAEIVGKVVRVTVDF